VEQHSVPEAQVVPLPLQGTAQWLVPSQYPEQQEPVTGQVLPVAVQPPDGWQVPLGQFPVQHSLPVPQLTSFALQGVAQWLVASQKPEQQSAPEAQVAALALHTAAQWLVASQKPEQQSVPVVQASVLALHCVAQWLVASQKPEQQSAPVVQAVVLALQGEAHWLEALQKPEQQSVPVVQASVLALHCVAQWLVASQKPEQQSAPVVQAAAAAPQVGGGGGVGSLPPLPLQPLQPTENDSATSAQSERNRLEDMTPPTGLMSPGIIQILEGVGAVRIGPTRGPVCAPPIARRPGAAGAGSEAGPQPGRTRAATPRGSALRRGYGQVTPCGGVRPAYSSQSGIFGVAEWQSAQAPLAPSAAVFGATSWLMSMKSFV
jgi:hypothetical protein